MPGERIAKSKLKACKQPGPDSHNRPETRLVLPCAANPQAAAPAIKEVIENWLLPTLLQEFLKDRGVSPKTRFLPKVPY